MTIRLTDNYGQTQYVVSGLDPNTTIDATGASWTLDSSSSDGDGTNPRPFRVYDSSGTIIKGGTTNGEISLTQDWTKIYYPNGTNAGANNAAAVWLERSPNATIRDWHIKQTWDGITIGNGAGNFLVEDVWMTDVRDDAIENDPSLSGTIRDTLIDGAFVGIATDSSVNGSANKMVIDGLLLRMEKYNFTYTGKTGENAMTHSSPFKTNGAGLEYDPRMEIKNSIIAIERVDHEGMSRLREAWTNVTVSENNYYLNLSDTPLPSNYPKPPAGFTILQGQAARDFWNNARDTWIAKHEGVESSPSPTPSPTPTPTPVPSDTMFGTIERDKLTGTSGDDKIDGKGGSDFLWGKGGNDILTGGAGKDVFTFDTKLGSGNVDHITDFYAADDLIRLNDSVFTKLNYGQLSASSFVVGEKALDSSDRIIYNNTTGALSYDADGTGSTAAVKFAMIDNLAKLTAADFLII
jgi:Ca2+-binding RTX toxin-like protein